MTIMESGCIDSSWSLDPKEAFLSQWWTRIPPNLSSWGLLEKTFLRTYDGQRSRRSRGCCILQWSLGSAMHGYHSDTQAVTQQPCYCEVRQGVFATWQLKTIGVSPSPTKVGLPSPVWKHLPWVKQMKLPSRQAKIFHLGPVFNYNYCLAQALCEAYHFTEPGWSLTISNVLRSHNWRQLSRELFTQCLCVHVFKNTWSRMALLLYSVTESIGLVR